MHTAIVFFPLLGFLLAGLANIFLHRFSSAFAVESFSSAGILAKPHSPSKEARARVARFAEISTTSLILFSAILSYIVFFSFLQNGAMIDTITLTQWLNVGDLSVNWALRVDALTSVMLVVVTTVSTLVHLYSIGYMHEDPARPRFFACLSFFTFSMLMLVTSNNLVQLFFGWEGVGLASYLLIGFWFQKTSAVKAAMKAFIVNRVGDFGFALGIFLTFWTFDSIVFDEIFAQIESKVGQTTSFLDMSFDSLTLICFLLFIGAMGKSAQFLLHTWLPDAMEGPTPVSALIHAATMVTAGVFMIARLSPLFAHAPNVQSIIIVIGATTAFFAASVALVQSDIKRVIAYSTCSQLGYMFVAMGVGAYSVGMYHLFTHAFFKALLFLGAGSVIHAMHHEQNLWRMGGLWRRLPLTFSMMLLGTLSLTGFPFTSGYYSKDAIIEAAYASTDPMRLYAFILLVVAAFLTSFYSWRLIFLAFFGRSRATLEVFSHAHESPPVMTIPLLALGAGSLLAGFPMYDFFVGDHQTFLFGDSLFEMSESLRHAMHAAPFSVKISPFVVMLAGFFLAYFFYFRKTSSADDLAKRFPQLRLFLQSAWKFDALYDFLFVRPVQRLAEIFWKKGDVGLIDRYGPGGLIIVIQSLTRQVSRFQTGYVSHYAFVMLLALTGLLAWHIFYNGAR